MDGSQTQALYSNTKELFGAQYIISFLPSFIEFSLTRRWSEVCRMVFWLHSEMVAIIRVDDRAVSTHSLFDVVTGVRTLSPTPLTNFKYLECSHQPQSPCCTSDLQSITISKLQFVASILRSPQYLIGTVSLK